MALLEWQNVVARYGPVEALRGVDVRVDAGEIVALIGANGAGKTTLLMTVSGQPTPVTGRVRYDGADLRTIPAHRIVERGIAHVPEGRRVFPRMSVLENLQLGAYRRAPRDFDADLQRVFDLFPILNRRAAQRAGTLSGGEQQMLALGRALMSRPRVLLLDEPSLGLAPLVVQQIFTTIAELNRQRGLTVVLVEQDAHRALRLAHRGYVLVNGQVTLSGSGAELLANPAIRAAYLDGVTAA